MIRWLKTLDPTRKLYLGNSIQKSDDREPLFFEHGGSGIVISGALVKEFANKGIVSRWEDRMHTWWAGDFMLADALYDELGIHVTDAAPMFNDLNPREIRFGEKYWCEPAISLHHMDAQDFDQIQGLEKKLHYSRLLLRDIYATVYPDGLPPKRDDWDNISDGRKFALEVTWGAGLNPHASFETCDSACNQHLKCSQFFFRNTTELKPLSDGLAQVETHHECMLSSVFRLGHRKPSQGFDNVGEPGMFRSWTSGWKRERIARWVERHWECPSGDHWVTGRGSDGFKEVT